MVELGWVVVLYHRAAAILVVGTALLSLQVLQGAACTPGKVCGRHEVTTEMVAAN